VLTNRNSLAMLAFTAVAIFGIAFSANPAMADNPIPIDPTTAPSGGSGAPTPSPTPATPFEWNLVVQQIFLLYPNATWDEVLWIALTQYNLLPPSP
jgi:hypothetical protein